MTAPSGTSPRPVGVGIIGAGNISDQYLQNLTRFPDVEVRFVADLDVERARSQAAKYGITGAGTVAELLADKGIEIVLNLTIPKAHVEVGLQILNAGKHVWAEKPLALDRASGRALLDRAAELGLRVASAPDTFLGAGLQSAQRLVEAGRIGTPLSALAIFATGGPESWHPSPEFLFDIGGGPLFDMGPYYLTALVQLFGPVARVSAVGSKALQTRVIGSGPKAGTEFAVNVPTLVQALIEFESGASAQTIFSFQSFGHEAKIELGGSKGALLLPDPNGHAGASTVLGGDEPEEVPAVGSTWGRGTGVVELARAIRAGVPERASGELAYHVLDIMASISEAAESHSPVDVASTLARPAALPEDFDPTASTLGVTP